MKYQIGGHQGVGCAWLTSHGPVRGFVDLDFVRLQRGNRIFNLEADFVAPALDGVHPCVFEGEVTVVRIFCHSLFCTRVSDVF